MLKPRPRGNYLHRIFFAFRSFSANHTESLAMEAHRKTIHDERHLKNVARNNAPTSEPEVVSGVNHHAHHSERLPSPTPYEGTTALTAGMS